MQKTFEYGDEDFELTFEPEGERATLSSSSGTLTFLAKNMEDAERKARRRLKFERIRKLPAGDRLDEYVSQVVYRTDVMYESMDGVPTRFYTVQDGVKEVLPAYSRDMDCALRLHETMMQSQGMAKERYLQASLAAQAVLKGLGDPLWTSRADPADICKAAIQAILEE